MPKRKRCSCGSYNCLIRKDVGDEKFNMIVRNIVQKNVQDIKESKQRLLDIGVPLDCIVYVLRNWEDSSGNWSYDEEEALSIIDDMDVQVVHKFGDGKEGFLCACLDGRNTRNMKQFLRDAVKQNPESWEYHINKISKVK